MSHTAINNILKQEGLVYTNTKNSVGRELQGRNIWYALNHYSGNLMWGKKMLELHYENHTVQQDRKEGMM